MMKDIEINFIDCEMTGLNANLHEIISFGLVKVRQFIDGSRIKFELLSEEELKLKLEHPEIVEPEALHINKYDPLKWQGALSQDKGMREIKDRIVKNVERDGSKFNGIIVAGHNVHFDLDFIRSGFDRYGIEGNFKYALDTFPMAFVKFFGIEDAPKHYSLGALADYYGITNPEAHGALSDARTTYEIYKKLIL